MLVVCAVEVERRRKKAKEDFRQFPRASKSGVRDEGRTARATASNVAHKIAHKMILLKIALTHPPLLQIKINLI